MNNNLNKKSAFSLQTDALYRDITEIRFIPEEEIEVTQSRKVGDKRYWKFLGILPLFRYRVKRNCYHLKDDKSTFFHDMEDLVEFYGKEYYLMRDGKVYRKSIVEICRTNKDNKGKKRFNSDADALSYIENLKEKCKNCGNLLS